MFCRSLRPWRKAPDLHRVLQHRVIQDIPFHRHLADFIPHGPGCPIQLVGVWVLGDALHRIVQFIQQVLCGLWGVQLPGDIVHGVQNVRFRQREVDDFIHPRHLHSGQTPPGVLHDFGMGPALFGLRGLELGFYQLIVDTAFIQAVLISLHAHDHQRPHAVLVRNTGSLLACTSWVISAK